ncbi:MAG: hypothetical protein Harvfovirus40_11 [Harvfovirus sp.]|uniref:Uncharacterized protein n=1 Tax=Harvfovirus sp. TaxID=2487768 RepID=A0A3G5A2U4_9VIRU|nr:MAG: hypothetical protein Harvfovirus40_11 [Harvfovirus sp.]
MSLFTVAAVEWVTDASGVRRAVTIPLRDPLGNIVVFDKDRRYFIMPSEYASLPAPVPIRVGPAAAASAESSAMPPPSPRKPRCHMPVSKEFTPQDKKVE